MLERLEAGDMPPDKAKQHPTAAQRHAGDPGPVLARRLSHAEYDYSIRDLTGIDLRPTKEFPGDPANQAGFDNSRESLAMSPALVKKYLPAARTVDQRILCSLHLSLMDRLGVKLPRFGDADTRLAI